MRLDRENQLRGEVLFFWGVGKPIRVGDDAVFGFAKVGKWGTPGTMVRSQGVFLRGVDLLRESDPARVRWELLPDGDEGLRAPKGPVSDEANLVELSDGSFYATYRTIDGYPCHAYSRDAGRTWTPPAYMTYTPTGRRVKHPRAANFVRKFSNGKYLYWYHNHGGEPFHAGAINHYLGRNPAWVCGGVERDGSIHWSEPEILLYDDDPDTRMSYPDFIEESGRYYVTETQKTVARVHEIDPTLLEMLWSQAGRRGVTRDGLAMSVDRGPVAPGQDVKAAEAGRPPDPPGLHDRPAGPVRRADRRSDAPRYPRPGREGTAPGDLGTIDAPANTRRRPPRGGLGQRPGHRPRDIEGGRLAARHGDRRRRPADHPVHRRWDPERRGGGPRVRLGPLPPELGDVNGRDRAAVAPDLLGRVGTLRIYDRALRVSEAVGNSRDGFHE